MKKALSIFGIAVLGGIVSLGGYKLFLEKPQVVVEQTNQPALKTVNANYTPSILHSASAPTDFTDAAEKTVHAVVHVKNTSVKTSINPLAEYFYGKGSGVNKRQQVGTGSGVIISADGYIITNNHVIDGANDLEITLNNRKKLKAMLIGTDAKNDIALLKVDTEDDLPFIPFANSDNIKIGEWVLAVGNPYNLNSTVTAGIISAKGRDLEGNNNTDAFIQTDAAVNPGNSGGALVNTRGELIGINTAITSRTGSFIGYSFAVPSNIAKKVIDDLLEFGSVQDALIGFKVNVKDTDEIEGVLIGEVEENTGADKAGLEVGDVITKINNVKITKFSELKGQLGAKRPGDVVFVTVSRDGEELVKEVRLTKKTTVEAPSLGIIFKDLTNEELRKYKIKGGAKITHNNNPNLKYFGVEPGFVITKINSSIINDALDAKKKLSMAARSSSPLHLEVINLEGEMERYKFN